MKEKRLREGVEAVTAKLEILMNQDMTLSQVHDLLEAAGLLRD